MTGKKTAFPTLTNEQLWTDAKRCAALLAGGRANQDQYANLLARHAELQKKSLPAENEDLQLYKASPAVRAKTKYRGIRDALKSIDRCRTTGRGPDSQGYAEAYLRCQRLVMSISHEAPDFPVGEGLIGLISEFRDLAEPTFTFWYDIPPSKDRPNPVIGTVTVLNDTEQRLITLNDKFSRYSTQPRVRRAGAGPPKPPLPMHLCRFLSGLRRSSPDNRLQLLTTRLKLLDQPFLMQDGNKLLLQRAYVDPKTPNRPENWQNVTVAESGPSIQRPSN